MQKETVCMRERKALPDSELDIMLVIWRGGKGVEAPGSWRGWRGP